MGPFVLGRHRVQEEVPLTQGNKLFCGEIILRQDPLLASVLAGFLDRDHLRLDFLSLEHRKDFVYILSFWVYFSKMSSMVISRFSAMNGSATPIIRRSVISLSSSHSYARGRVPLTSIVGIADPSPACKDQCPDF